jgi:hypothetical protein
MEEDRTIWSKGCNHVDMSTRTVVLIISPQATLKPGRSRGAEVFVYLFLNPVRTPRGIATGIKLHGLGQNDITRPVYGYTPALVDELRVHTRSAHEFDNMIRY